MQAPRVCGRHGAAGAEHEALPQRRHRAIEAKRAHHGRAPGFYLPRWAVRFVKKRAAARKRPQRRLSAPEHRREDEPSARVPDLRFERWVNQLFGVEPTRIDGGDGERGSPFFIVTFWIVVAVGLFIAFMAIFGGWYAN